MDKKDTDLQNTTQKTKDWATKAPLNNGRELRGRVNRFYSTSGTLRLTFVSTTVISHWNVCPVNKSNYPSNIINDRPFRKQDNSNGYTTAYFFHPVFHVVGNRTLNWSSRYREDIYASQNNFNNRSKSQCYKFHKRTRNLHWKHMMMIGLP